VSNYKKAVCRGAWVLGTACGKCERCEETRPSNQHAEKPTTITLSITEYEQLQADQKRMNWIDIELRKNGTVHLDLHGSSWIRLFSISTQHMKQQPSGRLAIDAAIAKDNP
jgi:PIN domain nuclease of toxin-antitoxin system